MSATAADDGHPHEVERQLRKIFICDDIWFDLFHFGGRVEVGQILAPLCRRFRALADSHLRRNKWPLGCLEIERSPANNNGFVGATAVARLYRTNTNGDKVAVLPFPDEPLPDSVIGFKRITISYVDHTVIAFLHRIRRLISTNGVITLELGIHPGNAHSWTAFADHVWPLLHDSEVNANGAVGGAIRALRFDAFYNLSCLRKYCSPSVLRACANLRSVAVAYHQWLLFPPDDSAGASDGQALCKWLHTPPPRAHVDGNGGHGHAKMLKWSRSFSMEELKSTFLNATTAANFAISVCSGGPWVPFELENELTGERLTFQSRSGAAGTTACNDWWMIERAPLGRGRANAADTTAAAWADLACQMLDEFCCGVNRRAMNVLRVNGWVDRWTFRSWPQPRPVEFSGLG